MSAGRRYRRSIQRAGAVELDHETRHLLGQVLAGHDDDAVTSAEFERLARQLHQRTRRLPPPARREVVGRLVARVTGGDYRGWVEA